MLRSLLLLALLCVVGLTACDSTGEVTIEDGELIVGDWALSSLSVDGEDRTALLLAFYESVTINFTAGKDFTLLATPRDEQQQALPLQGSYGLNTEAGTLVLTVQSIDGELREVASYEFNSETRLTLSLTTDGSLIEGVEGDAVVVLNKQSAE